MEEETVPNQMNVIASQDSWVPTVNCIPVLELPTIILQQFVQEVVTVHL